MKALTYASIGKRLVLIMSLVFAALFITATEAIISNRHMVHEMRSEYEAIVRPLAIIAGAHGKFNALRLALQNLARDFNTEEQNRRFAADIMQKLEEFEDDIQTYKNILDAYGTNDPYEKEALEYLYGALAPLREFIERIVPIAENNDYSADVVRFIREHVSDAADDISFELLKLAEILEAQAQDAHHRAQGVHSETIWFFLAIMAVSMVVLLLSAYVFARSILKPIRELTSTASDLADGKFNTSTISIHSKDELGILADSFRHLEHTVARIISDLQSMAKNHADGDFEYFMNADAYKGSYRDVVTSVNEMMQGTVKELRTAVSYMENVLHGGPPSRIKRFPGKKAVISDMLDALVGKIHFDMLTGVYNRRYMEDALNRLVNTLRRSGKMLSVLMIDIDRFKQYNDTYGHVEGDSCLRAVAKTIEGSILRGDDFVARYGGEEFAVILPNTDEDGARRIAERILENVRSRKIPHAHNEAAPYVTVSVGVAACCAEAMQNYTEWMQCADQALYAAKANGRDRYAVYQEHL